MKWLLRNQTMLITFLYLVCKVIPFAKLLSQRILIRSNLTYLLILALQFSNQLVKLAAKFGPDASIHNKDIHGK